MKNQKELKENAEINSKKEKAFPGFNSPACFPSLRGQQKNERMVDCMKIEKIEKYLEEVSEGTDFSFTVEEEKNKELTLYMYGDNPEGEDWCEILTIQNPKTKMELIESLYEEVWNCYDAFDVEENTYLWLEAKRNGFNGVPGVVDLVHNEEYKENALKEFSDKLYALF